MIYRTKSVAQADKAVELLIKADAIFTDGKLAEAGAARLPPGCAACASAEYASDARKPPKSSLGCPSGCTSRGTALKPPQMPQGWLRGR